MKKLLHVPLASVAVIAFLATLMTPFGAELRAQGTVGYAATTSGLAGTALGGLSGIGRASSANIAGAADAVSDSGASSGGTTGNLTVRTAGSTGISAADAVAASPQTWQAPVAQTSTVGVVGAAAGDPEGYVFRLAPNAGELISQGKSPYVTYTWQEYRKLRSDKAYANAMMPGSYGTAEFVPRRQHALDKVIQQAKDMQYSQRTVDAIAEMFKLEEYIDYDYDVRYGKDPMAAFARAQARYNKQLARFRREAGKKMPRFESVAGGLEMRKDQMPGFGSEDGGVDMYGNQVGALGAGDASLAGYDQMLQDTIAAMGGKVQELPPDVVASIEAAVHNAILDKLRAKGYDVAALNVFLQNIYEIKVIIIITTSELPRSAIRTTLRQVRKIVENEVLAVKFATLKLAQLSSFTILNEVDNHFYEHPVLYWEMQAPNWQLKSREISAGTPGAGEQLPQAQPGPEADQMLNEFLGLSPSSFSGN